jgi:hypothetical protein
MFQGLQQKEVSSLLHTLWAADPFKAKWAILAKAYTTIRDKLGKKVAPLDQFLKLCCPEFGIIGVADYLHELHWFVEEAEGKAVLVQETSFDPSSLESASNMSDVDIVRLCCEKKLFPNFGPEALLGGQSNSLMSVQTQARAKFMAAIATDPRGVAAEIFGIDISSIFFEIATDPTIMPMLAPFTDPVQAYNRNFAVPADVDPNLFEIGIPDLFKAIEEPAAFDDIYWQHNGMDITVAPPLDSGLYEGSIHRNSELHIVVCISSLILLVQQHNNVPGNNGNTQHLNNVIQAGHGAVAQPAHITNHTGGHGGIVQHSLAVGSQTVGNGSTNRP